ncbi:MAG: hypothetical protein IKD37_06155 [Clostridia bacterium]|nr:hypothetical protein [Clostridia bacterium]
MTVIYLSHPITLYMPMHIFASRFSAAARVAILADLSAERDTLVRVLASAGITPTLLPLPPEAHANDIVIAVGRAACALADATADHFSLICSYSQSEEGDAAMQMLAQRRNRPVYVLGKGGGLLADDSGEVHTFGDVRAYHPLMLLDPRELG